MKSRSGAARFAALLVYLIVIMVARPQAQQPASFSGSPGSITAGPAAVSTNATAIDLLVGRSTILNVGSTISRVSLTVPEIADAMVTTPQQLLIHGKQPGTISLFVWDRAGGIKTYEVSVRRDLKELADQVKQLFPGEDIEVNGSGRDVVLSGTVSSKYIVDKAAEIAGGYVEKKENVVNLLKQQEGVASNQVMLRVRFAEVSRNAMRELGAAFVANGYKNDWFGRTTTQQFAAPDFDSDQQGGLTFSDFLNVFLFNSKHQIGAVVKALKSKGLFQSLAEPNLIATNGKEASFLAGGEYPYPVAQAGGGNTSITIQFKEFGVRLSFTPTVLGNGLINLKVKPEVSSLDFANGVSISGFRVPALSTRRTETEVELQDGQTFAIAGLLNNTVSSTMSKIPGIGDIPILGWLFRSHAYQKQQTELVVMITPQIVRRGSTGVSEGLPSMVEPFLGRPAKVLPQPDPYTGSPRYPAGQPSARPGGQNSVEHDAPAAPAPVSQPATQPAPVSARVTPSPARPSAAKPATPAPVKSVAPAASRPSGRSASAPPPAAALPPAANLSWAKPATPAAPSARSAKPAASVSDAVKSVASATAPAPARPASPVAAPSNAATPAVMVTRPLTKDELKAIEEAREREREAAEKAAEKAAKARVEQEKRDEAARKVAEKKAEQAREEQEKLAKEQAKRDAEIAKKNAEIEKKNAEIARRRTAEQDKREKALAEAVARLREAQAAYEAQVKASKDASKDGSKGGSHDQRTEK